jgi:hypothetical protein
MSTFTTILNEQVGAQPAKSRFHGLGDRREISLQLVTTDTLEGWWKIEGSNINGADCVEDHDDAFGFDLTGEFLAAGANFTRVVTGASSQSIQKAINAGYVGVTFTKTGGAGFAIAAIVIKP